MSRFAVIHGTWIEHPDVGVDEVAVLAVLALHADRAGKCFPSQGLLAQLLQRSRPWVCKVIGRLVSLGLVEKTHQTRRDGGDRSCQYRLVVPEQAVTKEPEVSVSSHDTRSHGGDSITPENINIQETPRASESPVSNQISTSVTAVIPSEDWQPTDSDLVWALDRHPDADLQAATDRFVSRCRAKGYKYADLSAAWRSWLADDLQQAGMVIRSGYRRAPPPAFSRFAAWSSVAAAKTGSARHAA